MEKPGRWGVPPPLGVTWVISAALIGGRQIHKGDAPATEITQSQDGVLYTPEKMPRLEIVKEGWRKIVNSHDEVYWVLDETASTDRDGSSQWDFLPPEMQELILKEKRNAGNPG